MSPTPDTCASCGQGSKVFYLLKGTYCFGCYTLALKDLAGEIEAGTVPSRLVSRIAWAVNAVLSYPGTLLGDLDRQEFVATAPIHHLHLTDIWKVAERSIEAAHAETDLVLSGPYHAVAETLGYACDDIQADIEDATRDHDADLIVSLAEELRFFADLQRSVVDRAPTEVERSAAA